MHEPTNLLFILSDEHSTKALGCYGSNHAYTPNIDALARRGTRFQSAYTNSPVCVPARASLATGRYLHQIGFWDNADPYDGSVPSWHHRVRDAGHHVAAIGKLHFRSGNEDNGFTEEHRTMHVLDGKGDLMGLVRDELPERGNAAKIARTAGPGESSYTAYDRDIADRAVAWLRSPLARAADKPWVLFVSFVAPHFPLTAPEHWYWRYHDDPTLPMPKLYARDQRPRHPYLTEYASAFAYDKFFENGDDVRRAIAGYFGLCSFLDENIGRVVSTLHAVGQAHKTRIICASDHGDNLGARGLWGKSTMFEESVAVPLVLAGPGIPENHVCETPVSLVDVYPTILQCTGVADDPNERSLPGSSLLKLCRTEQRDRLVFSEYHAMGSTGGIFMVRKGRYKYVHYVRYPSELYDLESDPEELRDVSQHPAYVTVLPQMRCELLGLCNPADVDRRAKARQARLLENNGGRAAVIARGDLGFSPPPGSPSDLR